MSAMLLEKNRKKYSTKKYKTYQRALLFHKGSGIYRGRGDRTLPCWRKCWGTTSQSHYKGHCSVNSGQKS